MLLRGTKTCIKANGFVSKHFPISRSCRQGCSISRSCRQGCPIAPLVYILQIEPMVCDLRGDSDIKGVKLPGEGDIDSLETKLCMFDDNTQIINKYEDSLKI